MEAETPKKRRELPRDVSEPELEPASGASRAERPKHSKKTSCSWLLLL
jgi:hypothetical protein